MLSKSAFHDLPFKSFVQIPFIILKTINTAVFFISHGLPTAKMVHPGGLTPAFFPMWHVFFSTA